MISLDYFVKIGEQVSVTVKNSKSFDKDSFK